MPIDTLRDGKDKPQSAQHRAIELPAHPDRERRSDARRDMSPEHPASCSRDPFSAMSVREDRRVTPAFLTPSWTDRRLGMRIEIAMPAMLREPGQGARPVQLANLSTSGCRATGALLRESDRVWVRIEGLAPIEATVTWAEAAAFGLAFHQSLHWGVIEWLAREARSRNGASSAPPR